MPLRLRRRARPLRQRAHRRHPPIRLRPRPVQPAHPPTTGGGPMNNAVYVPELVAEDLARFVPPNDRHRSLTVVREHGDRDLIAETRQWLDKIRGDAGNVAT